MIGPIGANPVDPRTASQPADAKLRQSALQLEGVFVQRLFAAMRQTVPDDGALAPSSAEGTFTDLLDEKYAQQVPAQFSGSKHSIAQALYAQLRSRLVTPADGATR